MVVFNPGFNATAYVSCLKKSHSTGNGSTSWASDNKRPQIFMAKTVGKVT
jgi:hypothetical protein